MASVCELLYKLVLLLRRKLFVSIFLVIVRNILCLHLLRVQIPYRLMLSIVIIALRTQSVLHVKSFLQIRSRHALKVAWIHFMGLQMMRMEIGNIGSLWWFCLDCMLGIELKSFVSWFQNPFYLRFIQLFFSFWSLTLMSLISNHIAKLFVFIKNDFLL